nr:integrase, catalytic region, zinc finger, CCHC-type, peptidase aspartic, catalytic [Tanacetum cinerariifolium]
MNSEKLAFNILRRWSNPNKEPKFGRSCRNELGAVVGIGAGACCTCDMIGMDGEGRVGAVTRRGTTVVETEASTQITSTKVVPPNQTTSHSVEIHKPELKVYNRKPKNVKNVGSSKQAKIVESKNANHSKPNHTWGSNATDIPLSSSLVMTGFQIVLWYLDFGCSKYMTGNRSQLMNFVSKFLGTVRFRNDHIARIMGHGDYYLRNVTISRVYYVKGLGHNLFFVG